MTKAWGMSEEERQMTLRTCEIIEALERKIGRKFEPDNPIFLAMLASHPDDLEYTLREILKDQA